ncbi:MAG: hypothetical protein AAGA32_03710 [Pseudomonadota bacterium]
MTILRTGFAIVAALCLLLRKVVLTRAAHVALALSDIVARVAFFEAFQTFNPSYTTDADLQVTL